MNERRKLLFSAVNERFQELCEHRIPSLRPEDFGNQSSFVARVRDQFSNASIDPFQKQKPQLSNSWQDCEPAGLPALRSLALGESLLIHLGETSGAAEFLQKLRAAKKDPSQSFKLLMIRYECPLNFTCVTEDSIREFILERLMVRDRKKVEEDSLAIANNGFLWLCLNLIGIHAAASGDLRFLDALNYYFELLPANWHSSAANNWLMVSWLALYARALAAQCQEG
jgi:hypothetical protein